MCQSMSLDVTIAAGMSITSTPARCSRCGLCSLFVLRARRGAGLQLLLRLLQRLLVLLQLLLSLRQRGKAGQQGVGGVAGTASEQAAGVVVVSLQADAACAHLPGKGHLLGCVAVLHSVAGHMRCQTVLDCTC